MYRWSILLAVVSALAGTVAEAQINPLLFTEQECHHFILHKPTRADAGDSETKAAALLDCMRGIATIAEGIRLQIPRQSEQEPLRYGIVGYDSVAAERVNGIMVGLHHAYKQLNRWADLIVRHNRGQVAVDALQGSVTDASVAIHAALAARKLNEVFSAILVTGGVVENAGEDSLAGSSLAATAHVIWESKHLGAGIGQPFEFSARGRIGFVPTLNLLKAEADTTLFARFTQSFLWDIAGRFNFAVPSHDASEFSSVIRAGQTILDRSKVLVAPGQSSLVAHSLENGAASTEWFFEGGVEFSAYDAPIELVHAEGTAAWPLFNLGFFLRRDNRFRSGGGLAAYDRPDLRGVVRLTIDALKILDKRVVSDKPQTFSLGIGVEHEFAWKNGSQQRVPPGTTIVLRGDVNILKAMQGR